jgi:hypothetical protein
MESLGSVKVFSRLRVIWMRASSSARSIRFPLPAPVIDHQKTSFLGIVRQGVGGLLEFEPQVVEVAGG